MENDPVKPVNEYAKWSGLAFQMIATMVICVWGGLWLDRYFETPFPFFTLGLTMLGFGGSIYSVYRGVMRPK